MYFLCGIAFTPGDLMDVYINVHTYMCVWVCGCGCVCVFPLWDCVYPGRSSGCVYICTYIYIYIHLYYIYVCTYVHIYMYANMCIHTHTYMYICIYISSAEMYQYAEMMYISADRYIYRLLIYEYIYLFHLLKIYE